MYLAFLVVYLFYYIGKIRHYSNEISIFLFVPIESYTIIKAGGINLKIDVIETRTEPTVKIAFHEKSVIFHSKYDPIHEASVWATNAITNTNDNMDVLVIGLVAGYHITALTKLNPNTLIKVIEFNDEYYNWFISSPFYQTFKDKKNINIINFNSLCQSEKESLFQSTSSTNILIHRNGLDVMPDEYKNIKLILEDISFQSNSTRIHLEEMQNNFNNNVLMNDRGIGDCKNVHKGKPMILVSAGPSLTKQLPLLKRIYDEKKFLIGSVGTALLPLVDAKITPDFFMITDSKAIASQLPKSTLLNDSVFFYLSTAFHDTVSCYCGARRIVWQKGYPEAEKIALAKKEPTIQTGGSVATTLLDLMVYLGGESIALVGQDLAFTDGMSHAANTPSQIQIHEQRDEKKILNYYQNGYVYTANNLDMYRRWFESYAQEHPDLQLYNCTEGGAFIKNWENIGLKEFYLKFKD